MSPPDLVRTWNKLPITLQNKVIKLLFDLEALEDDKEMRDALWAARLELEMWLDRPIED